MKSSEETKTLALIHPDGLITFLLLESGSQSHIAVMGAAPDGQCAFEMHQGLTHSAFNSGAVVKARV